MPTNRKRAARSRRSGLLSEGTRWWLDNGRPLNTAEAEALGFENPDRASWQVFILHGGLPHEKAGHFWTRAQLREAGYGDTIDSLIAAGKTRPDRVKEAA